MPNIVWHEHFAQAIGVSVVRVKVLATQKKASEKLPANGAADARVLCGHGTGRVVLGEEYGGIPRLYAPVIRVNASPSFTVARSGRPWWR
jgi:hypothetical protein